MGGTSTCGVEAGGGGAISVDYGTLEAGATLLGNLRGQGGAGGVTGGAGTAYARSAAQTYGDLTVDNGTLTGNRRTILPALGSGTAQPGSGGATLATGRAKAIPPYFVGHWVEIRAAATGALKGTWRIASIGADSLTVTLAPNAGEVVPVELGDAWQGVYRFDRYTVRGQLQVVSADPVYVFSDQVVTGVVETASVHAQRLIIETGAQLTQPLTASASAPASLTIDVDELIVKAGGVIDVSGRGYPPSVTYPGHVAPGSFTAGSHLGEGGVSSLPAGQTFGNVYFPQENGGGGWGSRGGGAVRITANRVQVDGAIRANGETTCRSGAGGSVWIRAAVSLAGSGAIEAKGGEPTCGAEAGGGGAISIDYAGLDPASTLLDHLNAHGGSTGNTGGAGTIYLHAPSANLGSLTVDNGTVPGNRRTILPALGRGVVQTGSSGGTVLTGRDTNVPAYFIGSWVEVEGQDRFVKGVWRIAAVNGTAITLQPKATQPFNIAPGDRWRGIYRFDQVTVATGSVFVSTDPVIQLVPPLPQINRVRAVAPADSGYDSLYGNDEAPAWDKTAVSIAVGSVPGSYRITLGPAAVSDPDGIAEVSLTSGGRSVSAVWSADGASFFWAGRPGQQLYLVATDAHPRFRRSGWLELPPLPSGGWGAQLELAAGVAPLAVSGGADWLAVADSGVWLYGAAPQATDTVPPRTKDEEVLTLADGEPLLFAATRDRVDLLNRSARALQEARMPAATAVLDVAPGAGGAMLLVSDTSDPAQPALRLMELLAPAGAAPSLSAPSEQALPLLAGPALYRTAGFLHLFGLASNGGGVIYSWPSDTPEEPLSAVPQRFVIPAGWRALGPWERGALLLDGTAVRLVEFGTSGWSEVSHIDLPSAAAPEAEAVVVGSSLVVLVPGEIQVYDISDAAAPALQSRHPGSSYRQVTPLSGGEVLLWSRRMATPPLRWNPATSTPGDGGDGFHTVIDGLP